MNQGPWHQCGDRSQIVALEQLENGLGAGVVISPRDLSFDNAREYTAQYRALGADVLVDQQFFIPDATVGQLETYPIHRHRDTASQLGQIPDAQLAEMVDDLEATNAALQTSAVIAPGVVYEAGRADLIELNRKLFDAASEAAGRLDRPVYATVAFGTSITASDQTVRRAVAEVTRLNPDGWYFAFEFNEGRVPNSHASIVRLCNTGLTLAATGKPVFHAFAGPMALLSPCFGATAAGIGHSQNVWQFTRSRWQPSDGGGGGGDAPPRYFSRSLWGTFVYEDEFALMTRELREEVLSPSPWSENVTPTPPYLPWARWDANKHLIYVIGQMVSELFAQNADAESIARAARNHLTNAIALHSRIASEGIELRDGTNHYQLPWRAALESVLATSGDDYEMLRMLGE